MNVKLFNSFREKLIPISKATPELPLKPIITVCFLFPFLFCIFLLTN